MYTKVDNDIVNKYALKKRYYIQTSNWLDPILHIHTLFHKKLKIQ
jgi:hypothetical protein